MIIVRTDTGQEVEGWQLAATGDGRPVLVHPDGTNYPAASFTLQPLRALATTAAERAALEQGGYLRPHFKRRARRVRAALS
jgi:hypothetical protein